MTKGFIIDKDVIEGNNMESYWPAEAIDNLKSELGKKNYTKFRLLDDDGEVYFIGRFVGDEQSEDSFLPLDVYGNQFGCTSIEYYVNGIWEAW